MRILVTGVTGQVGAAIVRRLSSSSAQDTVVAADRALLDLSQPHDIARILTALRPDVIINPAAYTAVDRAQDERDLAFLVNAAGPEALARWAAARRVPLIYFSTDYVFDGSGQRPWREDDKVGPLNVYGASKLAGENAVRAADGLYLIVRTSWVYSVNGNNFVRTIARLAREREELRVVADQMGSPTPASLLANVLATILRKKRVDLPQTFALADNHIHIAAEGRTTWHGFAEAIVTGLKERGIPIATKRVVPITSEDYPGKARRPLNSCLDLKRLGDAYNIFPESWSALFAGEMDPLVRSLQ